MLSKLILFVLCLIFCFSCETNKDLIAIPNIFYIDSFSEKKCFDSSTNIEYSKAYPMYFGLESDTINLYKNSKSINGYRTYNFKQYRHPKRNELEIIVDTGEIIGYSKWFNPPPKPLSISDTTYKAYYLSVNNAHAVIIKNIGKDTLDIGYGEFIPIIIEAQDKSKNWQEVQKLFFYSCGTGLSDFYLPPNQIVITPCNLFIGNYETNFRVKYMFSADRTAFYSNAYKGTINYSIIEKSKLSN